MTERNLSTPSTEFGDQARQVMSWYGYGSPVGLGFLILSVGASALLLRLALFGLK